MTNEISNMYRQTIMEHYKNPRNKGVFGLDDSYIIVHLKNHTCGDDVQVAVKLDGDWVADIRQDSVGCSICCSSASVLSETLKGHRVSDAMDLIKSFCNIVSGGESTVKLDHGDALCFSGVSQFPARINCATLAWKAFEQVVSM